jgi:hypothetical protein
MIGSGNQNPYECVNIRVLINLDTSFLPSENAMP